MNETKNIYYTLGKWKVKKENEAKFVESWSKLGEVFGKLNEPPLYGTLIQSIDDPTLFYSFGPWTSLESINHMRSDTASMAAIKEVMSFCDEAAPGNYKLVKEIKD